MSNTSQLISSAGSSYGVAVSVSKHMIQLFQNKIYVLHSCPSSLAGSSSSSIFFI